MTTLDMRGKLCPLPVIEAKKALKKMKNGEVLKVIVDNDIARQNVQKLAKQFKLSEQYKKISDDNYEIEIVSGDMADNVNIDDIKECHITEGETGVMKDISTVVSVGKDFMGEGSAILGKKLLKGFFTALNQLDRLPGCILFYNAGAFLTCKDSFCLDEIKDLHDNGVEILTCGTCLNFYGITDDLEIGEVTNMYEIVNRQAMAKKIIRP